MLTIIPVRSRPDNLRRMIKAWDDTASTSDMLVAIDEDDPSFDEYEKIIHEHRQEEHEWMLRSSIYIDRMMLGPKLNAHALDNVDDYTVIGFLGDDCYPRTPQWDQKLMKVVNSTKAMGVYYPNDTIQGEKLPTHAFITTNIIKALGYMSPPGIQHLFIDNAWKVIGETVGNLVYIRKITMEHMHPIANKAKWDDIYRTGNAPERWEEDEKAYNKWLESGAYKCALHHLSHAQSTGAFSSLRSR